MWPCTNEFCINYPNRFPSHGSVFQRVYYPRDFVLFFFGPWQCIFVDSRGRLVALSVRTFCHCGVLASLIEKITYFVCYALVNFSELPYIYSFTSMRTASPLSKDSSMSNKCTVIECYVFFLRLIERSGGHLCHMFSDWHKQYVQKVKRYIYCGSI